MSARLLVTDVAHSQTSQHSVDAAQETTLNRYECWAWIEEISGGVRYVEIGDATTKPPISGSFSGNSGVGVGIKIGYTF